MARRHSTRDWWHSGLALIFLCLLPSHAVFSQSLIPLELRQVQNLGTLKSNEGYLLVKLDVAGPAPSIELVRLGEAGLPPDTDVSRQLQSQRRYKIDLKNKAKGFYLTAVKKGTYQITTINAPFFGLPYRVDTKNRRIWRFSIEEDALNYIGNFHIAAERQTRSVDTRLINRIASELTAILNLKDQLPERIPLRGGAGYRDDFLTTLEAATRSTQ